MYYVYILFDKISDKFYIGFTRDLKRRIGEHQSGKVYTTYRYQNFKLIFFEAFISEKDARRRERYFKTTKGKKTLRLMLRDTIR